MNNTKMLNKPLQILAIILVNFDSRYKIKIVIKQLFDMYGYFYLGIFSVLPVSASG